jgi:hypothetical protein
MKHARIADVTPCRLRVRTRLVLFASVATLLPTLLTAWSAAPVSAASRPALRPGEWTLRKGVDRCSLGFCVL